MRIGARLLAAAVTTAAMAAGCTSGAGTRTPEPPAGSSPAGSAHAGHGDPSGTPDAAQPLRPGERFITLTLPRPYRPAPRGGTDDYRCFLLDPRLTGPAFLTGSQFLPQNAAIVHHAILFRVDAEDAVGARRLDADSPGDGWTCFGGAGVGGIDSTAWVAAWAPGSTETLLEARTGYRLEPGSRLVMQVHYSLLGAGSAGTHADRSGIRLRLAGEDAGLAPLHTTLLPAPVELPCPAGQTGELCQRDAAVRDLRRRFGTRAGAVVTGLNLLCNRGRPPAPGNSQSCERTVRAAGTVHAVAGHMHLLGRSIRVELNPGTPGVRTLLDVPAYDFDNQSARPLAEPVAVRPGDTYRVTCTHDATLRERLPALADLPPRYVVWGDGTSDEMCLGVVVWSS